MLSQRLDHIEIGNCVTKDGMIINISDSLLKNLGLDLKDSIGKNLNNVFPKVSLEITEGSFSISLANNNEVIDYKVQKVSETNYDIISFSLNSKQYLIDLVESIQGISVLYRNFGPVFEKLTELSKIADKEFREFLIENPSLVKEIHESIEINGMNDEMLTLFESTNRGELKIFMEERRMEKIEHYVDAILKIYNLPYVWEPIETPVKTMKGDSRTVVLKGSYFNEDNKFLLQFYLDNKDLQDYRDALLESQNRFLQLFNHVPLGLSLTLDRVLVECNNEFLKLHGYKSKEDALGLHVDEFISKNDRGVIQNAYNSVINTGSTESRKYLVMARREDGLVFHSEIWARFIKIDGKEYSLGIHTDRTEEMEADHEKERILNELQASQNRFKQLFVNIPVGMTLMIDRKFIQCNDEFLRLYGYKNEGEIVGMDFIEFISHDEKEKIENVYTEALADDSLFTGKYIFTALKKDGTTFSCELQGRELELEGKRILLNLHFDVTEELKISNEKELILNELQETQNRFQQLFNDIPVALSLTLKGVFVQCNNEFLQLYGYDSEEELINTHFQLLIAERYRKSVATQYGQMEKEGTLADGKYLVTSIRKDGSEFISESIVKPIIIDGQKYDLTIQTNRTDELRAQKERERIRGQLEESHKLERLGLLSGGVAHDFNNLLQSIVGGLDILDYTLELDPDSKEMLDDIIRATDEARNLIKQLLLFSGKAINQPEIVDIAAFITKSASVFKLTIPNEIKIEYELQENINIDMDRTQLNQILINLIINAADATVKENGKILIKCEKVEINEKFLQSNNVFRSAVFDHGSYACMSVKDYGVGIPRSNVQNIFDPFYSSKDTGRGLGLSVVQGIVFQNKGGIIVTTEVDRGTEFILLFPLTKGKSEEINDSKTIRVGKFSGTILICDDEPLVGKVLAKMLEEMGMTTIIASNGQIGLDYYKTNPENFKFIILDLSMPVMSGTVAFQKFREINPNIPILISSGYSSDNLKEFTGKVEYLQKPYKISDLQEKITTLLDSNLF